MMELATAEIRRPRAKLCKGMERPRQRKDMCITLFQLSGFGTQSLSSLLETT